MTIDEYLRLRKIGVEFNSKILDSIKGNKEDYIYAAKILGFLEGKVIVLDNEDDSDIIMDYLIYEKNKKGKKLINDIYDSEITFEETEEEILEGMYNHYTSFFEVKLVDHESCVLTLIDLFDKNLKEYQLMDVGFSQTSKIGLIIFTRLIPIKDTNMASGLSFGFENLNKNRIINDYSFAKLKGNIPNLFLLAHKMNKQYGLRIHKMVASR